MKKVRKFTYPLAVLFGFGSWIRNFLFDTGILKSKEFDIPIIAVGNITVGGTGKTPHVEYITALLKREFKVATLSRGYKRKTKGFFVAKPQSTIAEVGDEAKQLSFKFPDVKVALCEKRVVGVERLCSEDKKLESIVLDDAFQHRYVKAGLSILLIDYFRPIKDDYFLPYGNLRESKHEMKRADIIIVTKTPPEVKPIELRIISMNNKPFPYQNLYFTTFNYGKPQPVFKSLGQLERLTETNSVMVITGIENPTPFIQYIEKNFKLHSHLAFPDHHNFKEKDIEQINQAYSSIAGEHKIVLTTEKDAMRLQELESLNHDLRTKLFYIPIEVEFMNHQKETFDKQIIDYVKKNSRNSNLHQR